MSNIKKVYLYDETHLPRKGWLQGCIICGIVTSKLTLFDTKLNKKKKIMNEIYTYICPHCLKDLSNKKSLKQYNEIVNKLLGDTFN